MSDDQPEERQAARVITVNPDGQALLFETWDPDRPELPTKWISPGGGVDDGETLLEAAARELLEETGMTAHRLLGPLAHARWWDLTELERGEIRFFPKNLLELVREAASEPAMEA